MPKSGACRERGKRSGLASATRPQAYSVVCPAPGQADATASGGAGGGGGGGGGVALCSTLRCDPETHGAMPRTGLRRNALAARLADLLLSCNNKKPKRRRPRPRSRLRRATEHRHRLRSPTNRYRFEPKHHATRLQRRLPKHHPKRTPPLRRDVTAPKAAREERGGGGRSAEVKKSSRRRRADRHEPSAALQEPWHALG